MVRHSRAEHSRWDILGRWLWLPNLRTYPRVAAGVRMTVGQLFSSEKIDKDFMLEQSDISSYWNSCYVFVTENWARDIENLSAKQGAWLTKILDDCVEKRIEGKHDRT